MEGLKKDTRKIKYFLMKTLSIKSRKSNAEDIGSLGKSSAASRSLAVSATYIYKLPLQYYIKNNEVENIRPSVVESLASNSLALKNG